MMDGEILSLSSSSSVSSAAEGQKEVLPKGESSFAQVEETPKSAEQLWYVLNLTGFTSRLTLLCCRKFQQVQTFIGILFYIYIKMRTNPTKRKALTNSTVI